MSSSDEMSLLIRFQLFIEVINKKGASMKNRTKFVVLGLATLFTLGLTIYYIFSINQEVSSTKTVLAESKKQPIIKRDYSEDELNVIATNVSTNLEYKNVNEFISSIHTYYNQTTGYGEIAHLNTGDQTDEAIYIISCVNAYLESEKENKDLLKDFEAVKSFALGYIEKPNTGDVKMLHRYFHDLDIGLNGYGAYDKVWGVTAVLGDGN